MDPAHAAMLRRVMSLTGLTSRALARKLALDAAALDPEAPGDLPQAALGQLRGLLERAQSPEPAPEPLRASPERPASALICADGVAHVASLADSSVDMILSDIPYGIGQQDWDVLHDNQNAGYLGASPGQERSRGVFERRRKPINGWSQADREIPAQYQRWCSTWAPGWLRVLRPGGSAVVFAGRRLAHRCICALEDAGFNHRDMLAWLRPGAVLRAQRLSAVYRRRGDLAQAQRWGGWRVGNLRPSFEPILWFFKPYTGTLADNALEHQLGPMHLERFAQLAQGPDNVLRFGFAPGERGLHPAQKPVSLLRALVELCTVPGHLVLDPFAGSASTAVAAQRCGRRYLAIERDPQTFEVARQRLDSLL